MSDRLARMAGPARWTGPAGAAFIAICRAFRSSNTLTSPTSATQLDGTWRLFQMTESGAVHDQDLNAGRFDVTFSTGRTAAKAD